jgi:hypothetical protein
LVTIGDVSINSRLFADGDATLDSRLFVASDVSLNGNVYVNSRFISAGDVLANTRLFVNSDVSMNAGVYANSLRFGSMPITKYYNWTGTIATAITTPTIIINFNNNSYYAKIHAFVYDTSNYNNISSQIVDVQGGNANSSTPSNNIYMISRLTTATNYTWNTPTLAPNAVTFTTNSTGGTNTSYYSIRIEVVQSNSVSANMPMVTSIQLSSNNAGGYSTTLYNY